MKIQIRTIFSKARHSVFRAVSDYFPWQNVNKLSARIEAKLSQVTGMVTRNGGRSLINFLMLGSLIAMGRRTKQVVQFTARFSFLVYRRWKASGTHGVVLYLKASQVLLQQAVGGQIINSMTPLKVRVKRTRSGLPSWIPRQIRTKIRQRDPDMIRLCMTLMGLYRVLKFKGTLKLSTIWKPGNPKLFEYIHGPKKDWSAFAKADYPVGLLKDIYLWDDTNIGRFAASFLGYLNKLADKPLKRNILVPKMFAIGSSSPESSRFTLIDEEPDKLIARADRRACSTNIWHVLSTACFIKTHPTIGPLFERWCRLVGSNFFEKIRYAAFLSPFTEPRFIGKLSRKEEPAGKIRIFAMVDPWTQWLLRPLHDWIFDLLKKIPQDGTHNQTNPLKHLLMDLGWDGVTPDFSTPFGLYSYDLSAATDRLPILLQKTLLRTSLWDLEDLWEEILVGRPYYIHLNRKEQKDLIKEGWKKDSRDEIFPVEKGGAYYPLRYAVGQPMGALSSWAMLALTHHLIVQYAWFLVCKEKRLPWSWYTKYALLGDDIVIAGHEVAAMYAKVMTELGVEIGFAKSLESKKFAVLEFAKRFLIPNDASPVAWRDIIASKLSTSGVIGFGRKWLCSMTLLLRFIGRGYKVLGSMDKNLWSLSPRVRVLLISYLKTQIPLIHWLSLRTPNEALDVDKISDLQKLPWKEVQHEMNLYLYELKAKLQKRHQGYDFRLVWTSKDVNYKGLEWYVTRALKESLGVLESQLKLRSKWVLKDFYIGGKLYESLKDKDYVASLYSIVSDLDLFKADDLSGPILETRMKKHPWTELALLYPRSVRGQSIKEDLEAIVETYNLILRHEKALEPTDMIFSHFVSPEKDLREFKKDFANWVLWTKPIQKWRKEQLISKASRNASTLALVPLDYPIQWTEVPFGCSKLSPQPEREVGQGTMAKGYSALSNDKRWRKGTGKRITWLYLIDIHTIRAKALFRNLVYKIVFWSVIWLVTTFLLRFWDWDPILPKKLVYHLEGIESITRAASDSTLVMASSPDVQGEIESITWAASDSTLVVASSLLLVGWLIIWWGIMRPDDSWNITARYINMSPQPEREVGHRDVLDVIDPGSPEPEYFTSAEVTYPDLPVVYSPLGEQTQADVAYLAGEGPYTLHELQMLNSGPQTLSQAADQLWLIAYDNNLLISPIGDLWAGAPW